MSDVGLRVQDLGFRVWSFMFRKEISSAGRPPGRHCKTQKALEIVNHNISGQHPRRSDIMTNIMTYYIILYIGHKIQTI